MDAGGTCESVIDGFILHMSQRDIKKKYYAKKCETASEERWTNACYFDKRPMIMCFENVKKKKKPLILKCVLISEKKSRTAECPPVYG